MKKKIISFLNQLLKILSFGKYNSKDQNLNDSHESKKINDENNKNEIVDRKANDTIIQKVVTTFKKISTKLYTKIKKPNNYSEKESTNFYSPKYRPQIHSIFIIILLIIIFYSFGKIVALLLTQGPKDYYHLKEIVPHKSIKFVKKVEENLITVRNQNLFKAIYSSKEGEKTPTKPTDDQNTQCLKADISSNLSIELKTTIVLQKPEKSTASISIDGKKELIQVRENEKVDNKIKIGKIERQKIIFRNLKTGQCEYIISKDFKKFNKVKKPFTILGPKAGKKLIKSKKIKGIKNVGDQFTISKKFINKKLENIDSILTQARSTQIRNPDGSLSFKITEIEEDSIFSYLGIENNDKISEINGKKIMGLNEIMDRFSNFNEIEELQLTVIKEDGTERNFEYNFEN